MTGISLHFPLCVSLQFFLPPFLSALSELHLGGNPIEEIPGGQTKGEGGGGGGRLRTMDLTASEVGVQQNVGKQPQNII